MEVLHTTHYRLSFSQVRMLYITEVCKSHFCLKCFESILIADYILSKPLLKATFCTSRIDQNTSQQQITLTKSSADHVSHKKYVFTI